MATCQKCGGEIQGWTCQGCGQVFRENDAGALVFDAMEAVAWRWRWPDTNKWHYADYNLHPEAEEVQALAVIPTEGREGRATEGPGT